MIGAGVRCLDLVQLPVIGAGVNCLDLVLLRVIGAGMSCLDLIVLRVIGARVSCLDLTLLRVIGAGVSYDYDIALLRLRPIVTSPTSTQRQYIEYSSHVQPACLPGGVPGGAPGGNEYRAGTLCEVSGWGLSRHCE